MSCNEEAVWLYGSSARGDVDELSDVDVLWIAPKPSALKHSDLLQRQAGLGERAAVSYYDWHQIGEMASYGCLFLHHLRLEGQPLHEGSGARGRFRRILTSLPRYRRVRQDLEVYREAVRDVKLSLQHGGSVPFELSVLATTLRHACVLGCYVIQGPNFGRYSAIEKYIRARQVPGWSHTKVRSLVQYKLWSEARAPAPSHLELESDPHGLCVDVEAVITRVEEDALCAESHIA